MSLPVYCSVCHEAAPRPVLICMDCPETPTYYCDTKCQATDLQKHGRICQDMIRKRVYRAGELLQSVFYAFREAAYDMKIKSVVRTDGILHVVEDDYQQEGAGQYDFIGPLFRFPYSITSNPADKAQILTLKACSDGLGYTFDLSRTLLKSVASTVEEAFFTGVSGSASTIRYMHNGTPDQGNYAHSVLAVEATNGEAYIIDPSGAQNGQFDPVLPFATYTRHYVLDLTQLHSHGYHAQLLQQMADGTVAQPEGNEVRVYQIASQLYQRMLARVKEWEAKSTMTITEIISVDSHVDYSHQKASLVTEIRHDLMAFVLAWENNGRQLSPVIRSLCEGLPTMGPNMCNVMVTGDGSRAFQKFMRDNEGKMRFDF